MSAPRKVWYAPNRFEAYGEEEIAAVEKALRQGWLAPGPLTDEFERKTAAIFGKRHGVMVNSGSSANLLALLVAGVVAGDEVVTCTLTFATVVAPIVQLGATPVFVDAEEAGRYVPSVAAVVAAVTPRTRCVMLANLLGAKPDWEALREALPARVVLIEDSCDTMTRTECTDIACASFYASHVITAGGGGGMVMCNDDAQRARALTLRDWGRAGNNSESVEDRFGSAVDGITYDAKFLYIERGYNFKSTEMNAAFGLVQLGRLDGFLAKRKAHVARYVERLAGRSSYVLPARSADFDWLAMPLLCDRRQELIEFLEERGVQTRMCMAGNCTRHPAFREFLVTDHAVADDVMARGLLLGAHHGLEREDVDRVCDLLLEFDGQA